MQDKNYYGYIYLIYDQKYNKIYIGQKKGKIEDSENYYGSGTIIRRIIKSRGVYFLKKIILGICLSKEELHESEILCIESFQSNNPLYGYNITKGGLGGFPVGEINGMYKKSVQQRWEELYGVEQAFLLWENKKKKTKETFKNKIGEDREEWKRKMSRSGEKNGHYGKTTFELQIEKYGEEIALIKRQEGINNRLNTINNWSEAKKKEHRKKLSDAQKKIDKNLKLEKYKETVANRTPEREIEIYKKRSKACSGENNGRAKTFKVTSPNNEEFIIKGAFKSFCQNNNLNQDAMIRISKGLREHYKGWKCEVLIYEK